MVKKQQRRKVEKVWSPQSGSQLLFMMCPAIEVLYDGTRGSMKTDSLIMDFAQHVGQGFGADWRGILFRRSFPQLAHIIAKTKSWYKKIFPSVKYNAADHVWTWPAGEQLLLRYLSNEDDCDEYQGHEYPWIGFEELTNWPDEKCYEKMKACNRSSRADMPRKYRSNCNPYGVGHSWVKNKFVRNPSQKYEVINDSGEEIRVRIHGDIYENKILLRADPGYIRRALESITDENLRKAWFKGRWDIVAGGAFADVWDADIHVLAPFEIPETWARMVDRSFDWGSSAPFSVGWWVETDGCEVKMVDGTTRTFCPGTLIRLAEWYGWDGKNPNKGCHMLAVNIAHGIKDIEANFPFPVKPGPADSSIFDDVNKNCIANDMAIVGIGWEKADKGPGSRRTGLERVRQYMEASKQYPMEAPGLFVFSTCRHFMRTIPVLPRDSKKMDEVDTDAEDHIYDEVSYRVCFKRKEGKMIGVEGV